MSSLNKKVKQIWILLFKTISDVEANKVNDLTNH